MSHNKITVGNQSPDSASNIVINLDDLSNVSATATDGYVLKYSSGGWNTSLLTAFFRTSGYAVGWSDASRTSGSTYTSTGSLDSYRNFSTKSWGASGAPKYEYGNITLNRGTHGGVTPTNERYSQIELNANGRYLLIATTKVNMTSSSSYVEWQWLDFSTDAKLSPINKQYGGTKTRGLISFIVGYAEVTSGSRVCDIRCVGTSGSNNDAATNKADILGAIQLA